MIIISSFADNLKLYRERAGYKTAKHFAEALDIPYTTYSGYETQGKEPRYELLCKIADYLSVSTDKLLGRDSPEVAPAFKQVEDKLKALGFSITIDDKRPTDNRWGPFVKIYKDSTLIASDNLNRIFLFLNWMWDDIRCNLEQQVYLLYDVERFHKAYMDDDSNAVTINNYLYAISYTCNELSNEELNDIVSGKTTNPFNGNAQIIKDLILSIRQHNDLSFSYPYSAPPIDYSHYEPYINPSLLKILDRMKK